MTTRWIGLFPVGLFMLSAAVGGAQVKLVTAADVAPLPSLPAAASGVPNRPADMPPTAPKVTCRGDQISISAVNATLEAILAEVRGCTGAHIDMPEGAVRVRAFEELGPGPVREVLDELLSGTQYNYVIQSSDANPTKVETVLLSLRTNGTEKPGSVPADLTMTAGRRTWQHMQKFDKPDPAALNEDASVADADTSGANESPSESADSADANGNQTSVNTSTTTTTASVSAPPVTPVAAPIVDPNSNTDPSKAIEERITAMQQRFDQRQKMIQKQNQPSQGTPNN